MSTSWTMKKMQLFVIETMIWAMWTVDVLWGGIERFPVGVGG